MMRRNKTNWCCMVLLLLGMLSGVFLTACEETQEESKREFLAMDTYMTLSAYGEHADQALADAEEEIRVLESKWSVTEPDSEIYQVNQSSGNWVSVSEETADVLRFALDMAKQTEGALDPTIYPILKAWGFTTDHYRVPDQEEIAALLNRIGYGKVEIKDQKVKIPEGMELDLGAVGKGYAGDLAASVMKKNGVTSALLNIGGNVQAVGKKPDGSDWKLAIQNPYGEGTVGVLEVSDCAVVTSGNYERYFTADDGKTYGHIIDPKNGYPVDHELASVTIVTEEGKSGDALSTSMFVKGLDGALEYWTEHGNFEMILMTTDQEIYLTKGIADRFTLTDDFQERKIHIYE